MIQNQKISYNFWLLIGSLFLYPFQIKISLLLLIIYLLITIRFNKPVLIVNRDTLFLVIMPLLLYLLYVLSLIYTDNTRHGLRDLETKAALIIIPLIILFYQRSLRERHLFSFWYIWSFVLACCYLLVDSFSDWILAGDIQSFYYDQFSDLMHPTYFTMCLTLAVMFVNELVMEKRTFIGSNRLISSALLFLLTVSMFLTSSRAGLSIGWLLILFQLFVYLYYRRMSFFMPAYFVGCMLFSVIVLSNSDSRFNILISEVTSGESGVIKADSSKVDVSPVSHRLTLYKSAFRVMASNPLGVGVGDVQDELVKVYREIGYQKAAEVRYNPHNQFLQTAVAIGWAGMVILIFFFLGLFIYALRQHDIPLAGLSSLIGLNALFESVFEVQRGVLLFAICLLFLVVNKHRSD